MAVTEMESNNKQVSIVDALSNNNLELARDLLLKKIDLQVGQKASWDSSVSR